MPKVFSATVDIDAPIEKVWQILIETANYGRWNKFVPKVETDFEIGDPITFYCDFGGKELLKQTEYIRVIDHKNFVLVWTMNLGCNCCFAAQRSQNLERLGENQTRYTTSDTFAGLLCNLIAMQYGARTQAGFDLMAGCLKKYAERTHDHDSR
eukprot:TRINITY_DN7590_c0_g2_i1.p1 TRINITY_DN7590_c0_g2~~TRINITY_DN7590_c0_g2_i1.p1  ORF type:complete len:153 (-),score=21.01 TRINITY_DN7590_c0_g2_i1:42-500(-)